MHHFGFEEVVNDKKRKVDKITKNAWKFQSEHSNKTPWFDKLKRRIHSLLKKGHKAYKPCKYC